MSELPLYTALQFVFLYRFLPLLTSDNLKGSEGGNAGCNEHVCMIYACISYVYTHTHVHLAHIGVEDLMFSRLLPGKGGSREGWEGLTGMGTLDCWEGLM